MALPRYPHIEVEDYLILDRNSQARYEYLDGELHMLAGGSTYHSRITINLASTIQRLPGDDSPCVVFSSDIRLQLSESRYVHPDVAVSCDSRDHGFDEIIQFPSLVIEVLSPGTEATDRGKKFLYYRECSSIQEYVMVDSLSIQIEVYHRNNEKWTLSTFGPGSEVQFDSLDIQFPIETIYRGMKLSGQRNKKNNR